MEMPVWILVNRETGQESRIVRPIFKIGRSTNLDICCVSNKVSRNHGEFRVLLNGTLHVKDNGSSNGIYINHVRIETGIFHPLHEGDEVGLGLHTGLLGANLGADVANDIKYIFIVRRSNDVVNIPVENFSSSLENGAVVNQNVENDAVVNQNVENGAVVNQNIENGAVVNQNIAENVSNSSASGSFEPGNQNRAEHIQSGPSVENRSTNNGSGVSGSSNCLRLGTGFIGNPIASQHLLHILESDDEEDDLLPNLEVKVAKGSAASDEKSVAQQTAKDMPVASTSSESHSAMTNNPLSKKTLKNGEVLTIEKAPTDSCKKQIKNDEVIETEREKELSGNSSMPKRSVIDKNIDCDKQAKNESACLTNKENVICFNNNEIKQEPMDTDTSDSPRADYTMEDGYIIINDDDFPCSQLFNDKPNSDHNNEEVFSESIFCSIKKELEELDRLENGKVYAYVNLSDSDAESTMGWISDDKNIWNKDDENKNCQISSEQKTNVQKKNVHHEPSSSVLSSGLSKKKHTIPPIINPHTEIKKNRRKSEKVPVQRAAKKRKVAEKDDQQAKKENQQAKKIKTSGFYEKKANNESAWKCQRPQIDTKEAKEQIHELRKKKLKEIAEKQRDDKESTATRLKTATAKVKVSDSRGKFLTESCNKVPSVNKNKNLASSTSLRPKNKITSIDSRNSLPVKPGSSVMNLQPQLKHTNLYNTSPHNNKLSHNNLPCNNDPRKNNSLPANNNLYINSNLNHHPKLPAVPSESVTPVHTLPQRNNNVPKYCEGIEDIIIRFLNWKVIWFQKWKDEKIPSPLHEQPLSRMCQNFSKYSDYYNTVMPVLELELWNHVEKGFEDKNDLRKKKFLAQIEQETKMGKYTQLDCLTYITKEQNDNGYYVKEEDIVLVQFAIRDNEEFTIPFMGYVTQVNKRLLQVYDFIDEDFGKALGVAPHAQICFKILVQPYKGIAVLEKYMYVRVVTSLVASARVFRSVKYLERSPLCQHVLKPTLALYKVPDVPIKKLFSADNLNQTQYEAVMEATYMCLRPEPSIYLIQGPPGTGKSTVIVNIIQQILFTDSKQGCILVVAPSNAAIDELTLRLLKQRSKLEADARKELKLVRLGPKNMIHPGVKDYSLHELANKNVMDTFLKPETGNTMRHKHLSTMRQRIANLKENCKTIRDKLALNTAKIEFDRACKKVMGRSWNENLKKTEETLLSKARIICTTLSSCIGIRMQEVFGGHQNKIRCCIVDEATQSREQEALIPLKLGIDKLVLVGDPKQLPAVTLSKEAKNCAHGQSLFARIMSHFEGRSNNPIKMLDTQYRMHPTICEFPSKTYYDGKLKSAAILKNRNSKLNILKPYVLFDFNSDHFNSQEYQNRSEIECVTKLLDAIVLTLKDAHPYTVGIVTPYNSQKDGIKAVIEQKTFRPNISISVNTVDSFQGQEKDIIIISYVREYSNNFVGDEQRLNVAITRAMYALYIIGSDHLLRTCATLGKIYDDAKRRYLVQPVNCRTSVISLSNLIKR